MKINKQQIESVSKLSQNERYLHFLSVVADWEEVWYLKKDFIYDLTSNKKILYLFPHKEYAEIYSTTLKEEYNAESVDLEILIQEILAKYDCYIGIFPTPTNQALIIEKSNFINDIEEECQKY